MKGPVRREQTFWRYSPNVHVKKVLLLLKVLRSQWECSKRMTRNEYRKGSLLPETRATFFFLSDWPNRFFFLHFLLLISSLHSEIRTHRINRVTCLTFVFRFILTTYLRWDLYSVCPPPVSLSFRAAPSSWHQTATSVRSVTHVHMYVYSFSVVVLLFKCPEAVCTVRVCLLPPGAAVLLVLHTRTCVWSPGDTALCILLKIKTDR